jgi:hypothetical protein
MDATYGKGFFEIDESGEAIPKPKSEPPRFKAAARETLESEPEEKAKAVDKAVERGVRREKYTPTNPEPEPEPETEPAPGEDIDPSDIAAVRAMLSGGK